MNLAYLGDALDHWKGSLFEYLQEEGALRDLLVDPMATDQALWTPADYALFARLLRVRPNQIARHDKSLAQRASYFSEIDHAGDLFLDPDTGVATSSVARAAQYVRPAELAQLLGGSEQRVVAVYQHVRAQKTCVRVDRCVAAVEECLPTVAWCSYESGTVAMLFLGRDARRIAAVNDSLVTMLGRHAERRVRRGGPTKG